MGKNNGYLQRKNKRIMKGKRAEKEKEGGRSDEKAKRFQNEYDRTFENIEKQMKWAQQNKFTLSSKTQNDSIKGYIDKVKTIVRKYGKAYGEYDIHKFEKERVMDLLKGTYKNPWTIKTYTSAINYFNESVQQLPNSPIKKLDIINNDEMKDYFLSAGIIRKSEETHTGHLTKETYGQLQKELSDSASSLQNKAAEYLELCVLTAARIDGAIGVRGRDISINDDGTAMVYLTEKGRKPRWTEIRNQESVKRLEELKNGCKNQDWFVVRKPIIKQGGSKGKMMNDQVIQQKMGSVLKKTVDKLGIDDGAKSISMHSGRKFAIQNLATDYFMEKEEDLRKMLDKRIVEDKKRAEEIKKEKGIIVPTIERKMKDVKDRINWVRKPGARGPEDAGKRRTKIERDLSKEELVLFLTSLDSGHYRLDVMRQYYVDTEKAKKESEARLKELGKE